MTTWDLWIANWANQVWTLLYSVLSNVCVFLVNMVHIAVWYMYVHVLWCQQLFTTKLLLASHMWLLGRLLPVILGKYVRDDDAHWKCYVQLLRILTISTATEVTENTVATLSLLIQDYLATFNSLYPDSITPKLHYLLHLPRQIQL